MHFGYHFLLGEEIVLTNDKIQNVDEESNNVK